MCYTFGMPQRVISLPVVWIYIIHLKCDQNIVPLCDHPVLFVSVCVIFRPLVIFEPSCDVQLHVFTTSPLLCLWCIPIPFKETHESHVRSLHKHSSILLGDHCHSIQHCLEVLLEMGLPWISWRLSQIELAHVRFASTCSHKRHSHHRILTQGIHTQRPEQPATGCFSPKLNHQMPTRPSTGACNSNICSSLFLFQLELSVFVNCSGLFLSSTIWCA